MKTFGFALIAFGVCQMENGFVAPVQVCLCVIGFVVFLRGTMKERR